MSDRKTLWTNAWESTAPGGLSDVATTLTVADASSLLVTAQHGCYIVIDPDNPALREFLYVEPGGKSGNVLTVERYQDGSAQLSGLTHAADAVVRTVALAQGFTDLHDRADSLQTQVDANDPTGVYLPLTGGVMQATFSMGNNKITSVATPTLTGDAATKGYVDTRETAITSAWQQGDVDHLASGDPHGQYLTEAAASTTYLPLSGGVMTGTLNMSQQTLSNPLDPTAGFHVGDRAYNDARYLGIADNAASATKLATARTIDITGDITATAVAFDGTANIAISAAVNNDSHTHDTRYYTESQADGRFVSLATPVNTADNSFAAYRIRNVIIQSGTPGSGGRKIGDLWFQT